MTRQELIDFCLTFPEAYEDYPYEKITGPNPLTAMRHRGNKRVFASFFMRQGRLCSCMKCGPLEGDLLSNTYQDITQGHLSKNSCWIDVYIGGDVPESELQRLIGNSYDLIKPKK